MRKALLLLLFLVMLPVCVAERILVTSDLHLTDDMAAHEATLKALQKAAEGVDGVIILGDSTNNAHGKEHANALTSLGGLGRPAYVIPGNHDVRRDHPASFIGMYTAYGWGGAYSRDADSASCAILTDGGTCLLLLDTNDTSDGVAALGGISAKTCAWVAETIASLPEHTRIVACGHHPILPEARWEKTPGADRLVDALRGVKLYLCGHDHGFAATAAYGIQQITVGQPQAYPGWAGLLEVGSGTFRWRVLPLYDADTQSAMRERSRQTGLRMGLSLMKGSPYEGDDDMIRWFTDAFDAIMSSDLTEDRCERMLADPAAHRWRRVETKTVVMKWLFGILEQCPQDVREIVIGE
ncbi:MAG: metallophosphoesterase [Clostridia bacterium]|nr:metallophosphoesterase [Clostridia bacterium]